MDECFKCGIEGSKTRLYDVISSEGIVKICAECQKEEDLPVLRKPTTFQLKEAEEGGTIYDRLSAMAGINSQEHLKKFHPEEQKKKEEMKKQEVSLRDLVNKNFEKKNSRDDSNVPRADMIDNFHWVVMMQRRKRKVTQAQLAKEIGESEAAVKMVERGVLPEDDYRIIRKLESFLGVGLLKKEAREKLPAQPKDLFDGISSKEITISDLRDLKKKALRDDETPRAPGADEEVEESIVLDEDADDLSEEDVGKIIWKR